MYLIHNLYDFCDKKKTFGNYFYAFVTGLQSPPPQGTEPPQFPPPPQPPIQSPGGIRNYGMRQSGDVEGVRLAHGNVPVIQDVSEADITAWRKRRIVPDVKPSIAKYVKFS